LFGSLVFARLSQKKIFIINAPFWFSGAWAGIKGVLPESSRESVEIKSGVFIADLEKVMERGQIPREYGGASDFALGESNDEVSEQSEP